MADERTKAWPDFLGGNKKTSVCLWFFMGFPGFCCFSFSFFFFFLNGDFGDMGLLFGLFVLIGSVWFGLLVCLFLRGVVLACVCSFVLEAFF